MKNDFPVKEKRMQGSKVKIKSILVVAHDAGGAELIAAYVKRYPDQYEYLLYAAGPATKIFRREGLSVRKAPAGLKHVHEIISRHREVSFVLTGTGWMTFVERHFILAAKKENLHTISYLDSWVNYRERFGFPERGWKKNLPDEIWVGDSEAKKMAKTFFPYMKITVVPNQYFIKIKRDYRARLSKTHSPGTLLFLSDAVPGMENVLSDILGYLAVSKKWKKLRIRFHPADDRSRYDALIKAYQGKVRVEKSTEKNIVGDLLRARAVIGCETVAMVAALLVGKRTVSLIEKGKKSQLPFSKIIRVTRVQDALGVL